MPALQPLVWGDTANRVSVTYLYAGLTRAEVPAAKFDAAVWQELVNILCVPDGPEGRKGLGLVPVQNYLPVYRKPWLSILALVWPDTRLTFDSPTTTGCGTPSVAYNTDPNRPNVVHVGWRDDPVALAANIAHECIHTLEFPDGGLVGHETGPSATGGVNVMDPTGPAGGRMSKARLAQVRDSVARHAAGQRFGAYYPLAGAGSPTVGWNTVGKVSFVG